MPPSQGSGGCLPSCQNSSRERNPRLPLQTRTARNPSLCRAPEPCDSNSVQHQILFMNGILSPKLPKVLGSQQTGKVRCAPKSTSEVIPFTRTQRPNLQRGPSVKCCSVCGGRISIGGNPNSKDSSNLVTSCIFVARHRCVGLCLFVRTWDNRASCADTSLSVNSRYVFYRRLGALPKSLFRPRRRIRIKGSGLAPLPRDISCTGSDMELRANRSTLFSGGGR